MDFGEVLCIRDPLCRFLHRLGNSRFHGGLFPGAASGLIMSMHYVAALTTPVAMGQLITWLDSMTLAMLLGSAFAFAVFGLLVTSVRERS